MTLALNALFAGALNAHQAGDLPKAKAGYEAALQIDRNFAPALHYLGLVSYQRQDSERAIALIQRALKIEPSMTEARYNLGNIFRELGRSSEAEGCYRSVLGNEPDNIPALHNLMMLRKDGGDLTEAEALARRLVSIEPGYADGHAALGAILLETDRPGEATRHLQQAAVLEPRSFEHLYNFGRSLFAIGELKQAEQLFHQALSIKPADADAQSTLGRLLATQYRHAEAIAVFQDLIRRFPDNTDYPRSLGRSLVATNRFSEATEILQRSLVRDPRCAVTLTSLGDVLFKRGHVNEAIARFRQALDSDPQNTAARSGLLFALCFQEDADPAEVYEEHCRFDAIHARHLGQNAAPFPNDRDPRRRLRIGYLSPDFRYHPGGHFLMPPIANHDRDQFEVFSYSTTRQRDELTESFRGHSDHWREGAALSDGGLAALVREDRIDILVECTGHLAGNRLLVFARKPAPVQVSFPIYPNTTGLSAIQYRIVDPYFAPPSVDGFHSEILLRLPDTHACYEPIDRTLQPGEAPCVRTGIVTFGSFNNVAKLGGRTIRLWADLLKKVPRSRLVLKWLRSDGSDQWIAGRFAEHGIGADRLQIIGRTPSPYRPYLDIDICLDPLYVNGGTTTCDALWMGVPVITQPGPTPFSRVGLCHLTNVGLPELIAVDDKAYIRIATELATNPQRLTELRRGLRDRFARSPLMDGARYTRNLETALRQAWTEWCQSSVA